MTLTVIIPNYNNERFLDKCLNSVISQTRVPDEILVVDDCSSDSSVDIIKDYEKQYPMVRGIYLTVNSGVSHARNVGITAATSRYITTLDADDFYYNSDKLKNEMEILKTYPDALVYSKLVYVDEKDAVIRYINYKNKEYFKGNIYNQLLSGKKEKIFIRDYCFPKSIIEKIGGYDEASSLFEDFDFLIRLCHYLPTHCTYEYGTAYRIKSFGLSNKPQEVVYEAKQNVYDKYIQELPYLRRISVFLSNRLMIFKRKIRDFFKRQ